MSLADLFTPNGRASRLQFLITVLVSLGLEILATSFMQALQARLEMQLEVYYFALTIATLPFAWIMACVTIRRLEDLKWHWFPVLPVLPAYFLPMWFVLGPASTLGTVISVSLIVYAVISHGVLAVRPPALAGATLPPAIPSPPPQPQQQPPDPKPGGLHRCPAGHYYDSKRNRLCPVCATSAGINGAGVTPFRHVVGWLVVVEGPALGKDFRLYAQQNRIGQAPDMEVPIEDAVLGLRNHATVGYDPLTNSFRISPLESTQLNGKPLNGPAPLQPYDRISLGSSALLFVPLCGPTFQWDLNVGNKEGVRP